MKKILLSLIVCVITLSISVCSAPITKDYSGNTPVLTVEGTGVVSIIDSNGDLVYIDDSEETGKIEDFELELTEPISYFTAYIDRGDETEAINFSVFNSQRASEMDEALSALSVEERFSIFPEFMAYMMLGKECEYLYEKMNEDNQKLAAEEIYQIAAQAESNDIARENIEKWFLTEKILKSTWSDLKYIAIEKMKIFEETTADKNGYEKIEDETQQSNVFKMVFGQAQHITAKSDLIKYINQYIAEELSSVPVKGGNDGFSSGSTSSRPSGGGVSIGNNSSVSKPADISVQKEENKAELQKLMFSDINEVPWAKKEIEEMAKVGIINGYADGSFKPDKSITRAEFAVLVKRCFELNGEANIEIFEDVRSDDWYFKDVMTVYAKGLINGFEGKFMPDSNITRQDAAVIIFRALSDKITFENKEITFIDESKISDYAKEPVGKLTAFGILSGMQDGSFSPLTELTRAQAAIILYRCNN